MASISLSQIIIFLFLLLSSNLLTYFFSTIPSTSSISCSLEDVSITSKSDLPPEFLSSTAPQTLPLGYNSNFESDTIHPPVGHPCTLFPSDLRKYMSYQPGGPCPDDELLAQKLLLRGCEPLPRRRCHPRAPANFPNPAPLPNCLWSTPSDSSVVWTHYTCKNYMCLINRGKEKRFDDCKDCFDLNGREKSRWVVSSGPLDFTIDEVLALKKNGTIRIGLDMGGGSGTFAVRMKEKGVTMVATTMNFNGPFCSFIASRGVIPLYLSVSQRLPFFDNTLDIVHSMHVLSNWIPTEMLSFVLFDMYRVLRPGGLFWLDHFFCLEDQLENVYVPMIEAVGFNKAKWVIGKKLDRADEVQEMYISAVLEKPVTKS